MQIQISPTFIISALNFDSYFSFSLTPILYSRDFTLPMCNHNVWVPITFPLPMKCNLSLFTISSNLMFAKEGEGEVAQSRPILCDPVDCNLLGFSVHGILQARILEWIAISFSRGSSWPRDRTRVSRIGGWRFNLWATRLNRWLNSQLSPQTIHHL